jgi:hypothetical protein
MMGAVISTLNARLTTQGLADIRGAPGLGFDDGSWINTIFAAAQMVATPAAAWGLWREWVYVGSPSTPNALNGGHAGFPEYHNV